MIENNKQLVKILSLSLFLIILPGLGFSLELGNIQVVRSPEKASFRQNNNLIPKEVLVSVIAVIPALPQPVRHYGPIKVGNDLYQIAFETLPSEFVTTEQNMVAIFLNNLQAFSHANMNGLIIGKVLTLPSVNQIRTVSIEAAQTIIEQQDRQWNEIQKDPGNPIFWAATYSFLPNIVFNPSSVAQIPSALTSMENAEPLRLTFKQSSVPKIEGQFIQSNGASRELASSMTIEKTNL